MATDTDEFLTTGKAAELAGVSGETLRRWANDGKIRHIALPSGRLRFRRADIIALLVPTEPSEAAS